MRKLVVALFAACATWVAVCASAALADGPGAGAPTVVAVGDSAISGEAGRWAGNTNGSSANVDALGPTAYYDNASNTAETTAGCHRSKAAEIGRASCRERVASGVAGGRRHKRVKAAVWRST